MCTPGFEQTLAAVPAVTGVRVLGSATGGILFAGHMGTVYHANLRLRTANRVLLRIGEFLARSYPMLFDRARGLAWEADIGFEPEYSIRVTARRSRLRHKRKIAQVLEDAIASRLGKLSLAPARVARAKLEFHATLFEDRCTLSFNTNGPNLTPARVPGERASGPDPRDAGGGDPLQPWRVAVVSKTPEPVVEVGLPVCETLHFTISGQEVWLTRGAIP